MRDSESVIDVDEPSPESEPLPAAPPPPPKPRFFGPFFWTGFGFGVLAIVFVILAGTMGFTVWMKRRFETRMPGAKAGSSAEAMLPAPPFPVSGDSPSDFALGFEKPDGTTFDAATMRGKTVFLNYWATWCGPCRAEMPAIQRLYDKTRDLGVVFLVVSDEKPEKIREYLQKNSFTLPVYRSTKSRPAAYETQGIPATFIFGPDGRVAFRHSGAARWDDDAALVFLRSLAPAPAAP